MYEFLRGHQPSDHAALEVKRVSFALKPSVPSRVLSSVVLQKQHLSDDQLFFFLFLIK